jgi:hypothetical protein
MHDQNKELLYEYINEHYININLDQYNLDQYNFVSLFVEKS